jgi:hypothetical protein
MYSFEVEGKYVRFLLDMIEAARNFIESQSSEGEVFKVKIEGDSGGTGGNCLRRSCFQKVPPEVTPEVAGRCTPEVADRRWQIGGDRSEVTGR